MPYIFYNKQRSISSAPSEFCQIMGGVNDSISEWGYPMYFDRSVAQQSLELSPVGIKLAPKYDMPYIYRDVFIDNKDSISHVKSELKKAVDIAKNRGYAIAIGHPKNATFKALKSAKNDILKDVEVVYISEIYEYYK